MFAPVVLFVGTNGEDSSMPGASKKLCTVPAEKLSAPPFRHQCGAEKRTDVTVPRQKAHVRDGGGPIAGLAFIRGVDPALGALIPPSIASFPRLEERCPTRNWAATE